MARPPLSSHPHSPITKHVTRCKQNLQPHPHHAASARPDSEKHGILPHPPSSLHLTIHSPVSICASPEYWISDHSIYISCTAGVQASTKSCDCCIMFAGVINPFVSKVRRTPAFASHAWSKATRFQHCVRVQHTPEALSYVANPLCYDRRPLSLNNATALEHVSSTAISKDALLTLGGGMLSSATSLKSLSKKLP